MTNIAIITPIYADYPQAWVSCIFDCMARASSVGIKFGIVSPCGNSNITSARNLCIQQVYCHEQENKAKYDYLMWIDSDIVFKLENIVRLLSHKKDIICGLYFAKSPPHFAVAGFYDLDKICNGFPKLTKEQIESKQVVEVDWAGCGFLLMKREIIEKMEYPWFDMRVIDLKKPEERSGGFKIKKEILSEDISFCTKMKEVGYKIFADTSILLKHSGTTNYSVNHFLAVN